MHKALKIFVIVAISIISQCYGQDVYRTPYGKKYHSGGCRMVENVSKQLTIEEAHKYELEACKICKPPIYTTQHFVSKPQVARGEESTVQCRGLTKKGTRCLHRTRIANGYCFQHSPK